MSSIEQKKNDLCDLATKEVVSITRFENIAILK